jgi:hypothetical protein
MSDKTSDGGNVQKDFNINVGNIANAKAVLGASGLSVLGLKKIEVKEFEVVVPDPWILMLNFANGWENYNAPDNLVKFMKHPDGRTEVRGWMGSGTLNLTAFTLPPEYAPAETIQFACGDSQPNHRSTLQVDSNGNVIPLHGTYPFFNIAFLAADSRPMVLNCFPAYIQTGLNEPMGIFVLYTEYGESKRSPYIKPGAAVNHCDWSFTRKANGNYIQINNITGLPYGQKTKVALMIVGA